MVATDLCKSYGNRLTAGFVRAVDHASFQLKQGEICGLVGPNGAGKTTLIRLIMGVELKDNGSVMFMGNGGRPIGYVPEKPTFFDDLSPFDNLLYIARLNQIQDPEKRCRELVLEYGLGGRERDPVGTFSKGMKQKLAIARSILHDPQVLIMDEPFSGLDPTTMIGLRSALKSLKAKGITMLISSHELNEIDQVCDAILFIKSGRILKKEEFDNGLKSLNLKITLETPLSEMTDRLARWKVLSLSQDSREIVVETSKSEIPDIVTSLVAAGARVMEIKVIQRKAEDMYAELFLKEADE